jgi:transcription initiation factor TFIIIB Brf1 subunit/transcription initiation factor TFIIB
VTDEEEKKREEDGEDKPEWNRGRVVKKESRSLPGYLVRRLIVRACSRLKLSDRTRSRALGLGSLLRESRSSPRGVAAGCVYLAGRLCEEPRTQYQVADAVRVTEVTVRANY